MAYVVFENATCIYPGADKPSVDKFDLDIVDGEFLVLVGPSGCGKSTTLRMLAGLEQVSEGSISIGGKDVTNTEPRDRDIAMVFQNYALYPHMSVRDNMGFALKMAGKTKAEINERVEEAAETLGLTEFLDRKPKALSGGQRQRVAMGRAIVRSPQVFLMDEPLSNLDAKLRVQTRTQIAALQRKLGVTTVYVTHDQTEALTMGDRIAVLKDGKLQQVGTPRELYDAPRNTFVASFIGSPAMNLSTFTVDSQGTASNGTAHIQLPDHTRAALQASGESTIVVGIRPEGFEPISNRDQLPADSHGVIAFTVDFTEELGSDTYLYGHMAEGSAASTSNPASPAASVVSVATNNAAEIVMRISAQEHVEVGETIYAAVAAGGLHLFSSSNGERLN
ncbi:ABC transporter ATP-binding protein [Corynebacterium ammoniagenes]|uniref:ABC transporter, ATP-binding protein n=1 Tax=Corynebacterium ammoniagenes DSM 20306 TaxID=649754 RepID=A0ABN0AHJ9_CORAM|nr:sn-glycerol-3-phosphate ABC transporter ATP-binding protein UgpC [Corynebacterium ammoniagenes]APT82612.1 sn-glycerol-3-phosphate ABC transporter ATP-binding protein [Corynebacterium ammoniagenes DSM 20306]AQS73680.1 sugar ABC transporter ATP-binding protein [Corynebacterium ammoniagenes]EFG82344.1 ABC transporter, ATP-binding protein [Corynebacterium ammoniagenes DSM 20306]